MENSWKYSMPTDLTGSYRAAAELCGCSHHTVKKAVEDRDAGLPPATRRARMIDDWRDVLEGWVTDSKGKIRGDKAYDKLVALGYTGTDRTTGRALAEIKSQWRLDNTRVHRPWITEPGLWLQYDFADGPLVAGRKIVLLVAWLAWSRYRVVIALRDRTAPSVFAGLDRLRAIRVAALDDMAAAESLDFLFAETQESSVHVGVVCAEAPSGVVDDRWVSLSRGKPPHVWRRVRGLDRIDHLTRRRR
jgi:hypothetical protein